MGTGRGSIVLPIAVMAIGAGWLLTVLEVLPGVNWVWLLALAGAGVLVMVVAGVDRVTAVVGPFLVLCTFGSLLRQTARISFDVEVPSLVVALGALMLLSRLLPLPNPRWIEPPR